MIAPETLLRALLLQAFYGIRSERQLREQVTYNMLFRWFVGLSMDAPVWDVTVFTKNRERLLAGDVAVSFLLAVMGDPAVKRLLSAEHFSVDGTLIDAWASMKSFRRKDGQDDPPTGLGGNAERSLRGEKRSNETHASTTDPDARLYRKAQGQPSRLCFMGHLLVENRNGLIVDVRTSHATGRAEREAAEAMIATATRGRPATLGSDKAHDAAEHVARLRAIGVTPHVAQNTSGRRSAIDRRTTRHATRGLCGQPAPAQAHRGTVRLDQGSGRAAQDPAPRPAPGRLGGHPDGGGLQPDTPGQAAGRHVVTNKPRSAVLGRWRIVAIEGCDTDYIDMLGPGHIQFDPDGGQIEFGAVQIGLECWHGQAGAHFNFQGSDEGTEVRGDGDAEIEEDGTLQGKPLPRWRPNAIHRSAVVNFRSLLVSRI